MSFVAAAVYSGYQADKGADAQVDAANGATQVEWDMYNQTRNDQMPWLNAGKGGLNALMALQGFQQDGQGQWAQSPNSSSLAQMQMQMDPGYKFRLAQGMDSVQNSAAARGGLLSGNTLKSIMDYGQNSASNEYMNAFNRLAGLSNTGQAQANTLGNLGSTTAGAVGGNMLNAGQARASGYAGQANAANSFADNGMKVFAALMGGGA